MDAEPFIGNSANGRSSNRNTSHPWIRYVVAATAMASIYGLIVLTLLLGIPISVLIIGVRYRDPRYCPIEPRISLFLIVNGSVSLGWITLTILISVITIFFAYHRSFVSIVLAIILSLFIFVTMIFSIIWLIMGSVWTFQVHDRVQHDYDAINHFYSYNYCHPVLYRFTYIYLIISYVLLVIQCCNSCLCRSREQE